MEGESEGSIPFLDVLVRRREQQFETSVYRKATHTDSYTHYTSNHHPATKFGIITCLKKRTISVCKGEYFKEELQHLTSTFRSNGYFMKLIRKALHKKKKSNDCQTNKKEELTLCLPYIKGLSETLQRTCQPLNIRIANKRTP